MTMVERVARAICEADVKWYAERFPSVPMETIRETAEGDLATNYSVLARAAIEAMKRPITDAMIDAGNHSKYNGQNISEIFDDMIDAALSE